MIHTSPFLVAGLLLVPHAEEEPGELMRNVYEVLRSRYYDERFREEQLPEIAHPFLERSRRLGELEQERELVHDFLSNIPVSHLGLMSETAHEQMIAELGRRPRWTFGFQLAHLEEGWFVDWVYEGGPAERAGIARGDQVLTIDGRAPEHSPRVDWRTDDAALPDPALHGVLADGDDSVELLLRRRPGLQGRLSLRSRRYSGWQAAEASARVFAMGDLRVGYVHYWFIPMTGGTKFLRELCRGRFADCDALIFDLRGRGGAAHEAMGIVKTLDPEGDDWGKPVVALVHADSRSAKEVIAWELQRRNAALLVGERTHGAVIPASFTKVGSGMVLMFPSTSLGSYTKEIEGRGITPDVVVDYPLPWTAGRDPVLEAGKVVAREWCSALAAATR